MVSVHHDVLCVPLKHGHARRTQCQTIYIYIMNKFLKYKDKIEYATLHGCGEPLLDKGLAEKVKIAKDMGFRGTGFATNCTHLAEDMSLKLLEAGLDSIICSIDGIHKKTHEAIRGGTDFDQIVANVHRFIELGNKFGKTRVLVRFIRQEKNRSEFDAFKAYWKENLDSELGDDVLVFDVHNWGEKLDNYAQLDFNEFVREHTLKCEDVYSRMLIYSNGNVGLCCADDNGFYELGNVIHDDPIEIYNNKIFTYFRDMMDQGRLLELRECKNCTIPRSRFIKHQASA